MNLWLYKTTENSREQTEFSHFVESCRCNCNIIKEKSVGHWFAPNPGKRGTMNQEISISYRAVKTKIYKLIDCLVEGEKSETEVRESIQRWWKLVRPEDRAVAEKYLAMVLRRSNAGLSAISTGVFSVPELGPETRNHNHQAIGKSQPAA